MFVSFGFFFLGMFSIVLFCGVFFQFIPLVCFVLVWVYKGGRECIYYIVPRVGNDLVKLYFKQRLWSKISVTRGLQINCLDAYGMQSRIEMKHK